MDETPSSQTVERSSQTLERPCSPGKEPDFRSIPPILILPAHFKDDEEYEFEEKLRRLGAPVTSDGSKAKVFVGKVGTKRRAEFELRTRQFKVEEVEEKLVTGPARIDGPPSKRRKIYGSSSKPISVDDDGSTTEEEEARGNKTDDSETEDEAAPAKRGTPISSPARLEDSETEDESLPRKRHAPTPSPDLEDEAQVLFQNQTSHDIVWVVKVDWIDRCINLGHLVPLHDDLVYSGKVLERPPSSKTTPRSIKSFFTSQTVTPIPASQTALAVRPSAQSILDRAKSDIHNPASVAKYKPQPHAGHGSRRFDGKSFSSSAQQAGHVASQTAHLLQQTTSEYEGTDSDIPEPPDWVKADLKYSCQRFTPANGPNEEFIEQLKKIRTARTLIDDDIGVRAYSTIIASIAAYPYKLSHPREILRLPGCDVKVANLWVEWKNTNMLQAVEDFEHDEAMKIIDLFYNIWGVGAKTARNFYYNNHWTELDDIIEYGWNDLDRVQQIGLKYYEEFLEPISRDEVRHIGDVVREHAVRVRDDRITVTIVGGYRRGKERNGDVDMIVSHPDLDATAGLVKDIVESLEETGWITHTLTMSLNNTNRGQGTLPFRTTKASGAGFDTLDKALVVWQDPNWPTRDQDLEDNPNAKNPNVHRRVDIIIAPWRTVGCAVMGWSSGTTFQRDLRRYCKHIKGWKFDSSGVRSRETGDVIELEGPEGVDGTPEDAEKKVFEGLGLEYIPPEMRCTN